MKAWRSAIYLDKGVPQYAPIGTITCSSPHHYAYEGKLSFCKKLVVVDVRTNKKRSYLVPPKHYVIKCFFVDDQLCYVAEMKEFSSLTITGKLLFPTVSQGRKTIFHAATLADLMKIKHTARVGTNSMFQDNPDGYRWSILSLTIE